MIKLETRALHHRHHHHPKIYIEPTTPKDMDALQDKCQQTLKGEPKVSSELFSENCRSATTAVAAFHAAEEARSLRLVCNSGSKKTDVDEDVSLGRGRPQSIGLTMLDI